MVMMNFPNEKDTNHVKKLKRMYMADMSLNLLTMKASKVSDKLNHRDDRVRIALWFDFFCACLGLY